MGLPNKSYTRNQTCPTASLYYTNKMDYKDWMNIRYDIVQLVYSGLGPALVRLAWHDAATCNLVLGTGGPHATINVQMKNPDPANKGLQRAIDGLAPTYEKYKSKISNADLWSFAGAVAVRAMGGPNTKWRPGREDYTDICQAKLTADNAIPNPHDSGERLYRRFLTALGMNSTDVVALITGGHGIGRCHREFSGYHGPWTGEENTFSNFYSLQANAPYTNESLILPDKKKSWQLNGLSVVNNVTVMQLPSDVAIVSNVTVVPDLIRFSGDNTVFFAYWQDVFARLLESCLDKSKLGAYVSTDPTTSV
ncbi:hypothetical protein HDU76_002335 [Blyttiomyces sp. JEL0837]|nr:hypothetical protein HDU76_002335 [Blyttiomyces sp. JEL0837]